MESSSTVKVAVRLRPMNEQEEIQGTCTLPVVNASLIDNTVTAVRGNGRKQQRSSFTFDNVFSSYTTQEEVFEATLKPVIDDVLNGFESTVFAYGQTGTGKTYTMEGDLNDVELFGVIPRSAEKIFDELNQPEYIYSSVNVSYLEIYNEELSDLLVDEDETPKISPNKKNPLLNKLEILEGKDGVFCRGLTEHKVESATDVLYAMKAAQKNRKIGETKMNKQSSRSHCVFTIRLTAKKQLADGNMIETLGKLHLVDLAGSECAKSASLGGETRDDRIIPRGRDRSRERSNINRSLLTLGRVILMLNEQCNSKKSSNLRIPYRDSKLTRILQDSLGGKCKTLIIATVSPSILSIDETMSTLNYAQSANGIINKPVATSYLSVGSGFRTTTASLADSSEVKSLEDWREMEMRMEYLQTQVHEAQAALARQYREQKEIIDRAEKAEEQLLETQDKLKLSEYNLKKTKIVLEATRETEKQLSSEASTLMEQLEKSIFDGNELYDLLVKLREADVQRREATKIFHSAILQDVALIKDNMNKLKKEGKDYQSSMIAIAEDRNTQEMKELDETVQLLHEIQLRVSDLTMTLKCHVQDENGILDILSKLSDNVKEHVKHARQRMESGETKLMTSIDNTRQNLNVYSKSLLEMEREFSSASGNFEQKMESLVMQANEKVTNMVSSAADALQQACENSSKTRQSLKETLESFHKVSASSMTRIQNHSQQSSKHLAESIQSFTKGMEHINQIEEDIEKQKSMMETKGVCHINELNEQNKLVVSQGNEISNAKTEQKRLEKLFVEEVLKGVTNLINTQMNILSEKHEAHLSLVEERNSQLRAITDCVKASATGIFNSINTTNESVLELSRKCRHNDEEMKETTNITKEILVKIDNMAKHQGESETKFVELTNGNAGNFATHEKAIAAASIALKNNSIDSTTFIAEKLHLELKAGASKLSDLAKTQTNYARDTASTSTIIGLEAMKMTRDSLMSGFVNDVENVNQCVTKGSQDINKVVTLHNNTADELRNDIETRSRDLGDNIATTRRSTIDAKKKSSRG